VTFNLPLLATFSKLYQAEGTIPHWNPHLAGGQPIVSNPNYGALYPPTWFATKMETARAFQLLVLAHLLWASLGGAWAFRGFGLSTGALALAALACGAGAWLIGLLFAARIFFGLTWLPWVLGAAIRLQEPARGEALSWQLLRFGFSLAGIGYAGEPVSLLLGGAVALLPLFWGGLPPASRLLKAGFAFGIAALLAAPALLPAIGRLTSSIRFQGLEQEKALLWSLRPGRLLELPFPRLAGDPGRFEEGYFFGWKLHDRMFPYILFLTPGSLLLLLALSRLLRTQPLPGNWPLRIGSLAGVFLALGRYNPLLAPFWPSIPILKSIRYPEKFILLTTFCLLIAGVLEWDRLLQCRRQGRAQEADLPALLATALAALSLAVWLGLLLVPGWSEELIAEGTPLSPTNPDHPRAARALETYIGETTLYAAAVALLFWAFRAKGLPAGLLSALAVFSFGLEQLELGGSLYRPIPRSDYERPSPLIKACDLRPGDRVWTEVEWIKGAGFYLPIFRRPAEMAQTQLERLDPLSGALFGLRHVLHQDYDLTYTPSARRALSILERLTLTGGIRAEETPLSRYLEAWGARCAIRARVPREIFPELLQNLERRPALAFGFPLPHPLPEARFVPEAAWHPDAPQAEAALFEEGFQVARREHLIGRPPAGLEPLDPAARVLDYRTTGFGARIVYRASRNGLLVVAQTYDPLFRATLNDTELPVFETGTAMLGILVPPGTGTVELRYRDPWLLPGLWLALLGGLLGFAARWLPRRVACEP
jgi:hypothetical protein